MSLRASKFISNCPVCGKGFTGGCKVYRDKGMTFCVNDSIGRAHENGWLHITPSYLIPTKGVTSKFELMKSARERDEVLDDSQDM